MSFFFYSTAVENLNIVSFCVSLCRLLYMSSTTVRQVRSAATDARPTCVPTCSLLMEAVATSVASATVSTKVQRNLNVINVKQLYKQLLYSVIFFRLAYFSASLLFPTS